MRRKFVWIGIGALVLGAFVLLYRGPGRGVIRGHVGDIAAAALVYALLGLAWRARPWVRAVATFVIAVAIELGQTIWSTSSVAGELLLGNTFDPWDLLAYAVGTALALGSEYGLGDAQAPDDRRAGRLLRPE
jgi:hypothetical protein